MELELAAIVWATTICRHYLRCVKFEVVTDRKVVAAILKKEVPNRRANWVLRLSEFDFDITHRKGEQNRNADFMSRWAAYSKWVNESTIRSSIQQTPMEQGE